jgi:hypothetical protein
MLRLTEQLDTRSGDFEQSGSVGIRTESIRNIFGPSQIIDWIQGSYPIHIRPGGVALGAIGGLVSSRHHPK